jgi:hypothetical protein
MCSFDAMSERRIHAFTHVTVINWSYSSEQFISAMLSKVRASKKNRSRAELVTRHRSPLSLQPFFCKHREWKKTHAVAII